MAKKKTKKKGWGGARKGAGRKPFKSKDQKQTVTKYIRCRKIVSTALDDFLDAKNEERAKAGLPPVSFSHWAREVLLVTAGRHDLTSAASAQDLRPE